MTDQNERRFHNASIVSIDQFDRPDFDRLFQSTLDMQLHQDRYETSLRGKSMAALFFEPSTRTQTSFVTAMQELGGSIAHNGGVAFSSMVKGESFEDTIRAFGELASVIVLRHPEIGYAERASRSTRVPVINAGDGAGEHPTQALLDGFTLHQSLGGIDNRTITMIGDLKYGRTIHSLAKLLTKFNGVHVNFVSPDELRIPDQLATELRSSGLSFQESESLDGYLVDSDALYVTRVQKERFAKKDEVGNPAVDDKGNTVLDIELYDSLKDRYVIDEEVMGKLNPKAILMHPLPRNSEIPVAIDDDPRSVYFDMIRYGKHVRKALLHEVLTFKFSPPTRMR